MSQDINGLVYRGLQRVFRNAIVRYVRERLQQAFPTDYLEKLKKPFTSEEWNGIQLASLSSREIGALDVTLVDEFDLLGVNHFFNIFDAHWAILVSHSSGQPKPNPKQ